MLNRHKTDKIITTLEEAQATGVTLAEAIHSLHGKDNVPFDDLWPAVMIIQQVSEREAMQLTKEWCLQGNP